MGKLLAGRRVLVVEDEMLISMMIEDMLADMGCEDVVSAATVAQAVALIAAQAFDAALLDMNLNGVSSDAVARAFDARGVPFAFSTGNSIEDVEEGYRDREFIRKPFPIEALSAVLGRLLPPR